MRQRLHLILFLLTLVCVANLQAAVFTVISDADRGPGTLRDALEQAAANGTSETDYIHFNVTRSRDYFIRIATNNPLPLLSSNLVIDGTTQPSGRLGQSNARFMVGYEATYDNDTDPLVLFKLQGITNVAIYGLHLKANCINRNTGLQPAKMYAAQVQASSNIIVGNIDKGNVLTGWSHAIIDDQDDRFGRSGQITIKSNWFGLDNDGVSTVYAGRNGGPTVNRFGFYTPLNSSITIGGASPAEGNIFNSSATDIFIQGIFIPAPSDHKVTIQHNKFGLDINDGLIDQAAVSAISVRRMNLFLNNAEQPSPYIADNVIAGKSKLVGIQIDSVDTYFLLERNVLGGESNGEPYRDAFYGTGILVSNSLYGLIGGNTVAEGNTIRYWRNGAIVCNTTSSIAIKNNSTYCNRKRAIEIRNFTTLNPPLWRTQPFVTINRISQAFRVVSGTAAPNSTVDLYYDDDCVGCEGKTYFATVTSDATGNWQYGGNTDSDHIVAICTDRPGSAGASSEYSKPEADISRVVIQGASCNRPIASICGLQIKSGTQWRWENEAGVTVGTDTCLQNITAGRYTFILSIGTGTCEERFSFIVPDLTPRIDVANVLVRPARCSLANGEVCGIAVSGAQAFNWENETGTNVGNTLCLRNVSAGRYRLRASYTDCIVYSAYFTVTNFTPAVDAATVVVTPATCNLNNGAITGIKVREGLFASVQWKNEAGVVVSTGYDIYNLAPGRYKFLVLDNSGACGDSTAYYDVPATPAPALNEATVLINNTTCNNSNGSIQNIRLVNGTAPLQYWWVNTATNSTVATTVNISNIAAGTYRLKVKDASGCDTMFSSLFTVINNGNISLDTTAVFIKAAACTANNGSITGIRAAGANSYQWVNTTSNTVIGTTEDIQNLPPGIYRFTAFNTVYGCTVISKDYIVPPAVFDAVQALGVTTIDATCNNNNGSIVIISLSKPVGLYQLRWLKDSVTTVAVNTLAINNLTPGMYYLVATDSNGCSKSIFKEAVLPLPIPVMNETVVQVRHDTCGFNTGAITNITVSSDVAINYQWYEGAQVVGNTLNLSRLNAGTYYLKATDARGCEVISRTYTVRNDTSSLPAPRYNDVVITRYSNALLPVKNALRVPVTYQLFADAAATQLITSNTTGNFTIPQVAANTTVYFRVVAGGCYSAITMAQIKVVDETIIVIPNAFSPNGDGVNDAWRIEITGLLYVNSLKVFNRWGQEVLNTKQITTGWDGKINGKPLPVGTYYYILDGIGAFNKRVFQKGAVTILR